MSGCEGKEIWKVRRRNGKDLPTSLTALPVPEFLGDGDPFSLLRDVLADDGEKEIAVLFGGPA